MRQSTLSSLPETKGAKKRSLTSKIAVFVAAAALSLAPALVAGTAANAAGPIVVTTPANGAVGVEQSFPNVVDFAGSNIPNTSYVDITYLDAQGAEKQGTFSGGNVDADGNWNVGANFAELSQGQTVVIATVSALQNSDGQPDPTTESTTVTFTLAVAPNPANPFTVTTPVSNSPVPVEDTTPTFSGTGNPGATIEITYGARSLATGVAATVVVGVDGTWTTETDFSDLEPGATEGSAIVTEYGTDGEIFPGTSGQRINFVFPSAPAPLIALTLTIVPESVTVKEATSTGVAFVATGFSPNEEITFTLTAPNGDDVPLAVAPTFANDEDGSYADNLVLLGSAGLGEYTLTVSGVRSERTVSGTFVVTANPVVPGAGNLPVVSG